jgi:flagellum-specific peptidoglycan hydrolase FlgJ
MYGGCLPRDPLKQENSAMDEGYETLGERYDEMGLQVPFTMPGESYSPNSYEALEGLSTDMFAAMPETAMGETPAMGRLVVRTIALLNGHKGTPPDLILRWNELGDASSVDVVIHFHGYSGKGLAMRLDRDKEAISGLDFNSPKDGTSGRTRPTVAILPRGNYFGGRSGMGYNFPNLTPQGRLQSLIQFSLQRVSETIGRTLSMGRMILTGHSGGGAPLSAILAHTDPDEVQIFDGLYGSGANVSAWAKRRIADAIANPRQLLPALRVLYRPGSAQYPGTQPHSEAVGRALRSVLEDPAAQHLRSHFRVEMTRVSHNDIPATFGWRLLGDAAALLPQVQSYATSPKGQNRESTETESLSESFDESGAYAPWSGESEHSESDETEEVGESQAFDEALAWLDVGREQESYETLSSKDETDAQRLESETMEAQEESYEAESFEQETESESLDFERYDELGDKRDTEWETASGETTESYEAESEYEQETRFDTRGLSIAEAKALAVTSTLETGKPGSFYGLSGNFDGQGVSFGLVNWTMGTGSLQVLLREFAKSSPDQWIQVFGPHAASFRDLIMPNSAGAKATQWRFAIEDMNEQTIVRGRVKWAVREPWKTYFRNLADNTTFQAIQIRKVRELMKVAEIYCQSYSLKSEAAFCFMFDAVASHGKWWPRKKRRGEHVKQKLQELRERSIGAAPLEKDVLLAIGDILAATSAPRWAEKVRVRKHWFVTGRHPRQNEIAAFRPSLDTPYATSVSHEHEAPAGEAPTATPQLASAIARMAEQEFKRWHPASGSFKETDDVAIPLLQKYYSEGVGQSVSAAQLKDKVWQDKHPWSSVFISWVMRAAGAGSTFGRHPAHRTYIAKAKRNRVKGDATNPFWAYRATEIAPQVGDIICKSRSGSGASYDNIDSGVGYKTHGDIVTEVHADGLRVMGGNVNQNVDTRRNLIRILPDGRLALDKDQSVYFAVVSCRGSSAAAGLAAQPQPVAPRAAPPAPAKKITKLTPAQFVAEFAPAARASQAKYGVPELVTLGQAALESGWGAHAPRFNFFGIKAKTTDPESSRQLLRTREVSRRSDLKFPKIISVTPRADGRYDYVVCDWFRAFSDAESAFNAHGSLLSGARRYSKAFAVGNNAYAFASEIAHAGYATAPDYERVLHSVMRKIESV